MPQKAFSKIWILVVVTAIAAGGVLAWQYLLLPEKETKVPEQEEVEVPEQEEVIEDGTVNWKTYRNEEYGYEIKYPGNWRVATSIMEWRKEHAANPYYAPTIEDWVMITNLSIEEEKKYLEALKNYMGIGSALSHVENADGRSIEIFPTTVNPERLRNPEPAVGWGLSDFREEKTKTGLQVIRCRERITWEMDRDFEEAFIPYPRERNEKVTYIQIRIERNEGNYEKNVFEKVLSTFRFLE